MQVDEPDHHANPSMLSRVPLALVHQGRLGLGFRMKVSSFMGKTLGCLVRLDDDDAKIRYSLCLVWLTVEPFRKIQKS
jgi:hypothetical protein